jgi:hypothetical protein
VGQSPVTDSSTAIVRAMGRFCALANSLTSELLVNWEFLR